MKFVALISGGKDSIFSIIEAQKEGHDLVGCVHLGRPVEEDEESYMYQTAASEVVQTLVEECIQVPLVHYVRKGKSVQTSLVYESKHQDGIEKDEVEDLYEALREAVDRFPFVEAVSSGALLSTYQRVRIENVCQRLGLTSLSYLWRAGSQHEILRSMIDAKMEVVLVRTAAPPGLLPRKHLNRTLDELEPVLHRLYNNYRMHVCGEGGEYESLCLYAPGLYRKRLVLDEVQVRLDENDDSVGVLWIKACHAENLSPVEMTTPVVTNCNHLLNKSPVPSVPISITSKETMAWRRPPPWWLPRVRRSQGGLWHTSGIVSPVRYPVDSAPESELAVLEARDVLTLLQTLLQTHECTAQDVGMVHLYLSDMAHFQRINQYYRDCFGVLLPPSRSCVALGNLPHGRRVMLDCWVLAGSGEYMRQQGGGGKSASDTEPTSDYAKAALANTSIRYRQVLHVQSLSHWAPVCVGPYSQANSLLGALHFLAGSIGLWPASMTLRETWTMQLEQSWKNLAQILDALDQSSLTENIMLGIVYVSDSIYRTDPGTREKILEISRHKISQNAGVVPGLIDDAITESDKHDGYEDEETRFAMEGDAANDSLQFCPLLVVSIPSMPVGAQVEVEIITATRAAHKCLQIADYRGRLKPKLRNDQADGWDAGYDFNGWPVRSSTETPEILWSIRSLDVAGAALATVVAVEEDYRRIVALDAELVLKRMLQALSSAIRSTHGSLQMSHLFQIRLYYISVALQGGKEIEVDVASLLEAAMQAALSEYNQVQPAMTVVPVHGIDYIDIGFRENSPMGKITLAMQAISLDPVSLQTELWIRHGRTNDSS